MSIYPPPSYTEPLPIFNPIYYGKDSQDITVAFLDANYLKYSTAQGLETLSDIIVNGTATFNNDASFNQDVSVAGNLSLSTVSVNNLNVGTGGIDCSGNITLTNTSAVNRQIDTSYLNLRDISSTNPLSINATQIYQNTSASYWDNNANSGSLIFAFNDGVGTQFIPFQMSAISNTFNKNMILNGLGNYLQFPDGTQQTTAYSSSSSNKTYSSEYLVSGNIPIPADCIGIGIRLVGKGGLAGDSNDGNGSTWNAGGSGGGASCCISNSIIPITTGSLVLTINNNTGQSSFITYNGTEICRAYNGNNGTGATTSLGGTGGVAQISGSGNTNACSWLISSGSAGVSGLTGASFQNCSQIPTQAGKPNCIFTTGSSNDGVRGCGQRYSAVGVNNQCPNATAIADGSAIITFYKK